MAKMNKKTVLTTSLLSLAILANSDKVLTVSADEITATNAVIETVNEEAATNEETTDAQLTQEKVETLTVVEDTAAVGETAEETVQEAPEMQATIDEAAIAIASDSAAVTEADETVTETQAIIVEDTNESWLATNPVPTEVREQSEAELVSEASFEQEGSRFSLAILPDTQFYSRYSTAETGNQFDAMYGSEPFNTQTQWIADNDDKYNIEMTLHLGDVVDRSNRPEEWEVADEAMRILEEADHSYAIIAGNHDVGGETYYDAYTKTFSPERAALNETLIARDASGAHEYHNFSVDGQNFAVLGLSWGADPASIAWANEMLAQNPDTPTILTSHQLVNIDSDSQQATPTDFGEIVWNNVIANHNQVFLTLNGHHHGATVVKRENAYGNPVHQILMDNQMAYMGGNGYMGLLEFDLTNNKIHQTTFSPWVMTKDPAILVADDQALLQNTTQTFTIDFAFADRFTDFKIGEPSHPSYTQEVRATVFENFEAPAKIAPVLPTSDTDYPVIEGTVAHWRFPTNQNETIVEVGGVITDVLNPENAFYRAPLNQEGIQGAKLADVYFTADHHPLSSNSGSVRFEGGSRNKSTDLGYKTASYFRTAADAPINFEEFENGYTFETFVKFDPSFTVENNEWMQWLVREGQREEIDNYNGTEPDEPPFAWALSNLKEVQFSFVDGQEQPNENSNWSGEIVDLDEWYHLTVVNDPATKTAILYVNGVPVLRNATDTVGIAATGAPWSLGAGQYDGQREAGFIGWIGETRLVDHPLDPSEWLTSRATVLAETPAEVTPADEEQVKEGSVKGETVAEKKPGAETAETPNKATPAAEEIGKGTLAKEAVAAAKTATQEKQPSVANLSAEIEVDASNASLATGDMNNQNDQEAVAADDFEAAEVATAALLPNTGSAATSYPAALGVLLTLLGSVFTFKRKRK